MRASVRSLVLRVVLAGAISGCSLDFASLSREADAGAVIEIDAGAQDAAADGRDAGDAGPALDGGGAASGRVMRESAATLTFTVRGAAAQSGGVLAVGTSAVGATLVEDGFVAFFGEPPWLVRVGGVVADRLDAVVSSGGSATAVGSTASFSVGTIPNVDALVVTLDGERVTSVAHWGTSAGLDERFHAIAAEGGELFMAGSIGAAGGSSRDGLVVFGAARTALRFAFPQPTVFYAVAASADTIYLAGERASAPAQGVVVAIERAAPHALRWSRAIGGASDSSIRGLSADAAGVVAVGRQEGRAIRWAMSGEDGADRARHTVGSGVLTAVVSGAGYEYLLGVSGGTPTLYRLLAGEMYETRLWGGIGLSPDLPGAAVVHTAAGPGLVAVSSRARSELYWLGSAGGEPPCSMSSRLSLSVLGAGGSVAAPSVSPVTDLRVLSPTGAVTGVESSTDDACP